MAREWRVRMTTRYERPCGGCSGVGQKCQLHHAFGKLDFTFRGFCRRQRHDRLVEGEEKRATTAVPAELVAPTCDGRFRHSAFPRFCPSSRNRDAVPAIDSLRGHTRVATRRRSVQQLGLDN